MISLMRGLASWRGLSLVAVVVLCLAPLVPWSRSAGHEPADCAVWDRAASEGIATLISDTSAAAELRFDAAMLQLRRARKSCRSGAIALAQHDYASLHQAFPTATGSIRPNGAATRGPTAAAAAIDPPE